jgi:hypothetical protein
MIRFPYAARSFPIVALGLGALSGGGCALNDGAGLGAREGLGCVDDSAECISRRETTLRHMVGDPSRAWVKEPPTPEAYASGVRLFAFKAVKKNLTCDELAHGRREAEGARGALQGGSAKLTPAQVERSAMLAGEVARELKNEINRRCNKG